VIVVDASAAIELLLNTPLGRAVAERIASPGTALHAPHLIDLEVAQVLRRLVAARVLPVDRGSVAVGQLRDLDLVRHAHDPFLARIWGLRANLTAYDAAYVSLAEVLGAPLLTCDRMLASSSGHVARVEVVEGAGAS
jgi:predicted nucleic acid-binding protein